MKKKSKRRWPSILGWTVAIVAIAVATPFIWPFMGFVVLIMPIIGIGIVLRAVYRELILGKRDDHYTYGPTRYSHLPQKRKKVRHLWTINDESESTR